jgi:hypothetical protein
MAAPTNANDRCEAQFYVGEWYPMRDDRAAALERLKAAVEIWGVKHPIGDLVLKTGSKAGFHVEHILAHNKENLAQYPRVCRYS